MTDYGKLTLITGTVSGGVPSSRQMTKCMTRSLGVTPKTSEQQLIVHSGKSEA